MTLPNITSDFTSYPTTTNYPITTSTTGCVSLDPNVFSFLVKEPSVNTSIKVVQVIDGFLGQVWHNSRVVWQSKPKRDSEKAQRAAARRQDKAIAALFKDAA